MQPWSQPLLWPHPSGAVACDPNFGNVVLLMGYEGTNGATSGPGFVDESPAAHGASTVSNATISTTQFKFGASAVSLSGTTSGLTYPDSNDWAFGSSPFTIEMFIYPNSLSGSQFLCCQWAITNSFALWINGTTLSWNVSTTGSDNLADISAGTVTTGSWQHICIDFDGSKYRLYRNGAMTGSFSTPRTLFDAPTSLGIGSNSGATNFFFNGYIDEARISKGVARYASDAGFAVPTAAFPRVQC